jgi:hypothetical protein
LRFAGFPLRRKRLPEGVAGFCERDHVSENLAGGMIFQRNIRPGLMGGLQVFSGDTVMILGLRTWLDERKAGI